MVTISSKIENLPGIGPKSAKKLHYLGIESVLDLLFYYPFRYQDFTSLTEIKNLEPTIEPSEKVTVRGRITNVQNKRTSRKRFTVTEATITDQTSSIKIIWFNQPFLKKYLRDGQSIILNGKVAYNTFSNELVMESPDRANYPKIVPIYSETAGITSKYILRLMKTSEHLIDDIPEWLPKEVLGDLLPLKKAIFNIHFPENNERLKQSRKRIAFDELFLIALKSNLNKEEIKKENAPIIGIDKKNIKNFIKSLPFKLTLDQVKAYEEILHDMAENKPMNRLLDGDVGSGKTVVAAIAAKATVNFGYNVAIMAPTEILANQHFDTFKRLLGPELVGIITSSKKEYNHKNKIIIGTHALIQKNIDLQNIGLVVIDEQHRFGVKQRKELLSKSKEKLLRPHFLSMTATPIPRTLHLALFNDLDISILKEKPKNRKEIKTRLVEPHNREKAYQFIQAHIKAGRQCYVICPLIEEGEESSNSTASLFEEERKTVKREFEKIKKIFPENKIEMLHGKMPAREKNKIMENFIKNQTQILVSTSVVEVGVDVPNATIMVIEDAERFGLAQLHQFRGRVGRAEHQSFCFLFSSTMSPKAIKRLRALEGTNDGFKLAEIDLETRGPGAVFGTEQSGMLDLKMASFSDKILIKKANEAAEKIIKLDPNLDRFPAVKEKISYFLENKHLE